MGKKISRSSFKAYDIDNVMYMTAYTVYTITADMVVKKVPTMISLERD